MIPKLLEVINISEIKLDKYNKPYKVITVETKNYFEIMVNNKKILGRINPKIGKLLVWENDDRFGEGELPSNFKIGEYILGDVVTATTEPYEIPIENKEPFKTTVYSTVVVGDSTKPNWKDLILHTFEKRGKPIVSIKNTSIANPTVNFKLNE
jgi:hypothetical protein